MPDTPEIVRRMQACPFTECTGFSREACSHAKEHVHNRQCETVRIDCANTGCSPVGGPPAKVQTPEQFVGNIREAFDLPKAVRETAAIIFDHAHRQTKEFFS